VPALTNVSFETGSGGPGGSALSGPNGADGIAEDQYLLNTDGGTSIDAGSDH